MPKGLGYKVSPRKAMAMGRKPAKMKTKTKAAPRRKKAMKKNPY